MYSLANNSLICVLVALAAQWMCLEFFFFLLVFNASTCDPPAEMQAQLYGVSLDITLQFLKASQENLM